MHCIISPPPPPPQVNLKSKPRLLQNTLDSDLSGLKRKQDKLERSLEERFLHRKGLEDRMEELKEDKRKLKSEKGKLESREKKAKNKIDRLRDDIR